MPTRKKPATSTSIQEWTAKAIATAEAAAPKRGRPVTTGTTPAKERKAKERAAATQQGGKRLHIMLTAEGARHLQQIMDDHDATQTRAVHIALERGH